MHCQHVSSFDNAPMKMYHLGRGPCVCVYVCVCVLYQEGNIRSTFKVTGGSTAIMKLSTENGWIM